LKKSQKQIQLQMQIIWHTEKFEEFLFVVRILTLSLTYVISDYY